MRVTGSMLVLDAGCSWEQLRAAGRWRSDSTALIYAQNAQRVPAQLAMKTRPVRQPARLSEDLTLDVAVTSLEAISDQWI